MKTNPTTFRVNLRRGTVKGWRGFVWMLKIILPVSLVTFLLDVSGLVHRMDGLFEPLMGVLRLPAMAALPMIIGLLTGIYGAIAAMAVLPFTSSQMTLLAVFLLIAHNLIQEGVVQHRSGCSAWTATAVRLLAAVLTVVVTGWFLDPDPVRQGTALRPTAAAAGFWPALEGWAVGMAWISLKILFIITALMVLMELLNAYRLIDRLLRVIQPCMGLLGLDRDLGMLWLTATVFGIAYGGAVIVEEVDRRQIDPEKLKALHFSIGVNHAVVEDPALFLPLGVHPFWLWIPRLIVAIAFVHAYRMWRWLRRTGARRRGVGVALAVMVLFAASLGRASEIPDRSHAFSPGERLTFVLKWTVIPAGEAVLEVLPQEQMAGQDVYHFVLTARSNAFVDAFYAVRDRIDAWADTKMQRSLLYRKKQHEGSTRRDITVSFDWEAMHAQYVNHGDARDPIPITAGTFDPLAIFYWSRAVDLSVGSPIQRPVTDGKKHVVGFAHVVDREHITVPAGTFDTFLIEPDLTHVGGVFEKSRDAKIQLWVTADHRRLPVKLKSKVVVGSFSGELVSMTGAAAPATAAQ
ncbi:hypothetical protein DSCO28_53030 [Desulfosarcina ovata subsp. sediminis]|uniref:Iron transporter n=1 Tax=Desulfosarcina ovata subsp. sediminis TaxID=885957 RepID=A0A5K7ZWU2_9BACT|nr:DUF3108 domain-containing protein [Desulfosarcina ovata]BBO84737.1 hypothetical protein DSCO28_53030 [Desulfosarcina ovata subsp. sediminis]